MEFNNYDIDLYSVPFIALTGKSGLCSLVSLYSIPVGFLGMEFTRSPDCDRDMPFAGRMCSGRPTFPRIV